MRTVHVIGNVQLDVLASPVISLPPAGGDLIIDRIEVRPAGAAGNVALALAALHTPHRLFGALGDDYAGRLVLRELADLNLSADIQVIAGGTTGISIAVEAPERERAFLTAHGILQSWGPTDLPADAADADIVLLTGYFSLPALRGQPTADLLRRARHRGATTVFDTGWDPEDWQGTAAEEVRDLLPLVDIFLPNEPEALALTGQREVTEAAQELGTISGGWVIVTRGPRGVLARSPAGLTTPLPAPAVTPLDTTAAGDSFAAGLIAELAADKDMATALRTGVAVSSTVVGRPSHHRYPTRTELAGHPVVG